MPDEQVAAFSSYPSSTGDAKVEVTLTNGSTGAVNNAQTATIKFAPLVIGEMYIVDSVFVNNIVGKVCTVAVHIEVVGGEGALAGNKRDSKTYAGTEAFGGYIGGVAAHTPSYITILNSSGGALTYSFVATISGRVSITTSVA